MTRLITEVGHNNPPPDATFAMHVDDLFAMLSDSLAGGEVDDDAKEAAIDAILDDFRTASKDADKERAAEKKPFLDAGKAVDAKWKPIVEKADRGALACKQALTPYRVEKQRIADAAAQKARDEAAEREKAAQAALRQSDDLEAKFQAEQELATAKKLNVVANRIDRAPTGLRTYWEAEITDMKEALRHYLKAQPDAFTMLAQSLADKDSRHEATRREIPGVQFIERKAAA